MTRCRRLWHMLAALSVAAVVAASAAGTVTDNAGVAAQTHAPPHTLAPRQTTPVDIFPTATATSQVGVPAPTGPLTPWPRFPLKDKIGLLMPLSYPYKEVYMNVPYLVGWVEQPTQFDPDVVGGWMRKVAPVIVKPDYTIQMLPVTGNDDPESDYYYPYGRGDICGSLSYSREMNLYGFRPDQVGWHMLVLNQTWIRPTINDDGNCTMPYVNAEFFYATQAFSVAPWPTTGMTPTAPTGAFTTWVDVSTKRPGSLPQDESYMTTREKVGVGVGAAIAGMGVIGLLGGMWCIRRRRFIHGEAFERMRPEDREAYLRDHPRSILNPNRPAVGCYPSRSCMAALEGDLHGHPGVVHPAIPQDEPSSTTERPPHQRRASISAPPLPAHPLSAAAHHAAKTQQAAAATQQAAAATQQAAAAHQVAQVHQAQLHAAGMRQAAWAHNQQHAMASARQWHGMQAQPIAPMPTPAFGMALPQQQVHYTPFHRPPYSYSQPSRF